MLKKRNVEKSQKRSVESKYRHKMETIGERHKYAPDFTKLDKYQTFSTFSLMLDQALM